MDNKIKKNLPSQFNCTICVIGLGYVGLPLAVEFAKMKHCLISGEELNRRIIGFDLSEKRIKELTIGDDITKEISAEDLKYLKKIDFSFNVNCLKDAEIYIVSVPTPIDKENNPDLSFLEKASEMIGLTLPKRPADSLPIIIYEILDCKIVCIWITPIVSFFLLFL